ncbi:MAG: vitamin B12-dependent ribonucleotide reductase [Planctomycetes bacterium]|nr:vitamin B12-dependent ribonucleotide reductase [Planctomycetota bacterium]
MDKSVEVQTVTPQDELMELGPNTLCVLEKRYLAKDDQGDVVETPKELFMRVARIVGEAEQFYEGVHPTFVQDMTNKFYNLMASGRFMPNSPTLMNAGRSMGMLSACFVLPVEDSINGIFDSIKHTALIQKAGGGTGFDFSRLRPEGDIVKSSGGRTSGPLSFIKVFSEATQSIQQGAFRRGANMGMMRIDHPDVLKFITVKDDLVSLTNYNISISVTDSFMERLREDPGNWHFVTNPRTKQSFPLKKEGVTEKTPEKERYWKVGELWDLIVQHAHRTGEPGLIFIDRVNQHNPTPHVGPIEATNPCGEQPLLPYEACNLGSINVALFVENIAGEPRMNWDSLRETIHISTRYLDNVVDANRYPLPEIEKMCLGNRKIGLGIMGFADALFRLGIKYDSHEGVEFGRKLAKFLNDEAHDASHDLARERGSFPNWEGSIWDTKYERPMRNAATTTIAPTGTISIIAGCTSGIEPAFSVVFQRNVLNGEKLLEVNPIFKQIAIKRGFYSEELMEKILNEISLQKFDEIPEDVKQVFRCAHDIAPEWHVRMQAAFQDHNDSSISKTTNFHFEATTKEVEEAYNLAYDLGCKGITVYRDGCRGNQPMSGGKSAGKTHLDIAAKAPANPNLLPDVIKPIPMPDISVCVSIKQITPHGKMHVKISVEPKSGREREVFAQLGKGGDVASCDLEAICRMVSLFLRCNGSIELVEKQLEGIGSSLSVLGREGRVMSLADGLAKAISKYLRVKNKYGLKAILLGELDEKVFEDTAEEVRLEGHGIAGEKRTTDVYKIRCPEEGCGGVLMFQENCQKCVSCGYTKC